MWSMRVYERHHRRVSQLVDIRRPTGGPNLTHVDISSPLDRAERGVVVVLRHLGCDRGNHRESRPAALRGRHSRGPSTGLRRGELGGRCECRAAGWRLLAHLSGPAPDRGWARGQCGGGTLRRWGELRNASARSTAKCSVPTRSSDPFSSRGPSGGWRLYVSCASPRSKHWWIEAVDADSPEESGTRAFAPWCYPVTTATAVKDPVITVNGDGTWQMWVCCHPLDVPGAEDRMWTAYATSDDGLDLDARGETSSDRLRAPGTRGGRG